MEPNYEKLINDLRDYGQDTVLNLLYYIYQDFCSVDKNGVLENMRQLDDILDKLSLEDNDAVSNLTIALCTEYEKRGFLGGVRIGAKLIQELNEKCSMGETDCTTGIPFGHHASVRYSSQ